MYNKIWGQNQAKIESILKRTGYKLNPELQIKTDEDSQCVSIVPQSQFSNEDAIENTNKQNNFCISIPCKRDNISNYEIFIPRHFNQLSSENNSSGRSSVSSTKIYQINKNNSKIKMELVKKQENETYATCSDLPLSYDSLKISGLKVIEAKAKSNFDSLSAYA